MNKKRTISVITIGVAIVLVLATARFAFGGRGPGAGPRGAAGEGGTPTATERVYSVELDQARTGTIRSLIRLNGEIVPTTTVDTFAEVAGEVQRVFVQVGDRVSRGQTVATVDPSRPGARFEASPVTAPISGTITAVYVEIGGTVSTATPIVTVGVLDTLEVVVDVPERFVGSVQPDIIAEVELSAFPGSTFSAPTSEISPLLDSTTRTKEVRFLVDPDEQRAEAGMFVSVTIPSEIRDDVVVVPIESVVTRAGQSFVYTVAADSTAVVVPVEVGLIENQRAEIQAGLEPGAPIVVRGQNVIEAGSRVQAIANDEIAAETGGDR